MSDAEYVWHAPLTDEYEFFGETVLKISKVAIERFDPERSLLKTALLRRLEQTLWGGANTPRLTNDDLLAMAKEEGKSELGGSSETHSRN